MKQQKKDQRTKLRTHPDQPGYEATPAKPQNSREAEKFTLGEGKGFITDKTVVKKRYIGSVDTRQDLSELEKVRMKLKLGKRERTDIFETSTTKTKI